MRTPVCCALWLAACVGCSSDGKAPGTASGGTGSDPPVVVPTATECGAADGIAAPLRRLTQLEYNQTVRDLLGTEQTPADGFPADTIALGFNNNAGVQSVTPLHAEGYMSAAEALAAEAIADLAELLPCDVAQGEACARSFITDFGRRAYRRPLSEVELQRYVGLYSSGAAVSFEHGIELVLQAMLQSVHFHYRFEFGRPGADTTALLTDHELATRLSYLLWGTTPDAEISALADAGQLSTRDAVAGLCRQMLDDPRARRGLREFYGQWLGLHALARLSKDSDVYPEFTPEVHAAMEEELPAFLGYIYEQSDASLFTLLTAPVAMVSGALAPVYGTGPATTDGFSLVEFTDGERAGLLTQTSLLAVHALTNQTSPIHRGKFVRERLFCQEMPPTPPDLVVTAPDLDPNLSTRERFAQHATDPTCATCHDLMDPIGLGFENYDGIGRYRIQEAGAPIDASGRLVATDVDGEFNGVSELGALLASSQEVQQCVATQWFRYAFGRAETPADACAIQAVNEAFAASNFNLKELLVALAQTDSFLFRGRIEGSP